MEFRKDHGVVSFGFRRSVFGMFSLLAAVFFRHLAEIVEFLPFNRFLIFLDRIKFLN